MSDLIILNDGTVLDLAGVYDPSPTGKGNPWHDPRTGQFTFGPPGVKVLRGAMQLKAMASDAKRIIEGRRVRFRDMVTGMTVDPNPDGGYHVELFVGARAVDRFNVPGKAKKAKKGKDEGVEQFAAKAVDRAMYERTLEDLRMYGRYLQAGEKKEDNPLLRHLTSDERDRQMDAREQFGQLVNNGVFPEKPRDPFEEIELNRAAEGRRHFNESERKVLSEWRDRDSDVDALERAARNVQSGMERQELDAREFIEKPRTWIDPPAARGAAPKMAQVGRLKRYRQYDVPRRPGHRDLEESLEKNEWRADDPLVLRVDKRGYAYVSDGNHRLAISERQGGDDLQVPVQVKKIERIPDGAPRVKLLKKDRDALLGKAGGYSSDTSYGTNTKLGEVGEKIFLHFTKGQEIEREGGGKSRRGAFDVRVDGYAFEVKANGVNVQKYKATPKPEEIKRKLAWARENGVTPAIALPVIDTENDVAHIYWRPGVQGGGLSEGRGWKYLGSQRISEVPGVNDDDFSPGTADRLAGTLSGGLDELERLRIEERENWENKPDGWAARHNAIMGRVIEIEKGLGPADLDRLIDRVGADYLNDRISKHEHDVRVKRLEELKSGKPAQNIRVPTGEEPEVPPIHVAEEKYFSVDELRTLDIVGMNARIRSGNETDDDLAIAAKLDKMFEEEGNTDAPFRAYRGTTSSRLESLDEGAEFRDREFSSWSWDLDVADTYVHKDEGIIMVADVPEGTKALRHDVVDPLMDQKEVMFARSTLWRVDRVEDRDGNRYVHVSPVVKTPAVDHDAAISKIRNQVRELMGSEDEDTIDALTNMYHEKYDEASDRLVEKIRSLDIEAKFRVEANMWPDPLEHLSAEDRKKSWIVEIGEHNEHDLAAQMTAWESEENPGLYDLEDTLTVDDTDFFPDQSIVADYFVVTEGLRGNEQEGYVTLYRGMDEREHVAWKNGEEIPVGKFFTDQPTSAYASDIEGVEVRLFKFRVRAKDVVEAQNGAYQLIRPSTLKGKIIASEHDGDAVEAPSATEPQSVEKIDPDTARMFLRDIDERRAKAEALRGISGIPDEEIDRQLDRLREEEKRLLESSGLDEPEEREFSGVADEFGRANIDTLPELTEWARDEGFEGYSTPFDPADLDALDAYRSDEQERGAYSILTHLRDGEMPPGDGEDSVKRIDDMLNRHQLKSPVAVWRGAEFDSDYLEVGKEWDDLGYVSSTVDREYAVTFVEQGWMTEDRAFLLKLHLPAGSTGTYIDADRLRLAEETGEDGPNRWLGEREFLLPRGSRFRVVSQDDDGTWHVDVTTPAQDQERAIRSLEKGESEHRKGIEFNVPEMGSQPRWGSDQEEADRAAKDIHSAVSKLHSHVGGPKVVVETYNYDDTIDETTGKPVDDSLLSGGGAMQTWDGNSKSVILEIDPRNPAYRAIFLHEYGHHVDHVLGVTKSAEGRKLVDLAKKTGDFSDKRGLLDHEVFADAYSWWATRVLDDPDFDKAMNHDSLHYRGRWDDDDFERIAREIEAILDAAGLQRREWKVLETGKSEYREGIEDMMQLVDDGNVDGIERALDYIERQIKRVSQLYKTTDNPNSVQLYSIELKGLKEQKKKFKEALPAARAARRLKNG